VGPRAGLYQFKPLDLLLDVLCLNTCTKLVRRFKNKCLKSMT